MAVKKNNATTADDQETKVGGNVVTVNHNSSEPLVKVDVQTAGVAQQVTVVVKFGNEEQNCSKRKGETPRSPPKTNPWNEFQKQHRGTQLTKQQLSALYQENKEAARKSHN